jgi:hypothetical protein
MVEKEDFLSKKFKDRLNIAISPLQKQEILKIFNTLKKREKEDLNYKSFSSFIRKILDLYIKIYESGKSFEDIENSLNTEIKDFINKYSHLQVTELQENTIKLNKYVTINESLFSIIMNYIDLILKEGRLDDEKLLNLIKRFESFLLSNKLTKSFDVEIYGDDYIVTYTGTHRNIHFEHVKGFIALIGILGFALKSFLYSPRYVKLKMKKTYLINEGEVLLDKRKMLLEKNLEKFLNFHYILNDERIHSWIRLSKFQDAIISFNNYEKGREIINRIIEELSMYSNENFKIDILRLFNKLNWIELDKNLEENLSFSYLIQEGSLEYKLINDILVQWEIIEVKEAI